MPIAPSSRSRCAGLALVAALALGAGACSSDSGGSDAGPTTAAEATSTSAATSTTAAPTTTTVPAGPVGLPDAPAAATRLYDAWVAGDRAAATAIADPAAVDAIWAATPGPYELYRGCDTGEFDTGGCLYRDRSTNNTIQIDLEKRETGWVVAGAFFSAG